MLPKADAVEPALILFIPLDAVSFADTEQFEHQTFGVEMNVWSVFYKYATPDGVGMDLFSFRLSCVL